MAKNEYIEVSETCEQLAEQLICFLNKGVPVSSDTLFFLESTYGIEVEKLKNFLKDDDSEEWQMIARLIFHPPFSVRASIEELLYRVRFSRQDELVTAAVLKKKVPMVPLILPDNTRVTCPLTDLACTVFVEKLYITRQQDSELVTALHRCLVPACAVAAMVEMRCRKVEFRDDVKRFFLACVEKLADRHDLNEAFVLFVVHILNTVPDGESVEQYLLDKRKYCRKVIQNIRDFEKRLEQYGMEYLLMQRYQVPHESEEEMNRILYLLDLLVVRIMNIRDHEGVFQATRDLGSFHPEEDMAKLFRTLS